MFLFILASRITVRHSQSNSCCFSQMQTFCIYH